MIVLDTNVFSALMQPRIEAIVAAWVATIARSDLYCTAVTRAEIRYGIARLPDGRRKADLARRAEGLFADVSERTLPFDVMAADAYGVVVAHRTAIGRPIGVPDAQIASIARAHHATVATRNTDDFEDCGVELVNPWDAVR